MLLCCIATMLCCHVLLPCYVVVLGLFLCSVVSLVVICVVTKARSGGYGVRRRQQSLHCRHIYSAGSSQLTGRITNKQLSPPKPGKITNSKNTYKQNKNLPLTERNKPAQKQAGPGSLNSPELTTNKVQVKTIKTKPTEKKKESVAASRRVTTTAERRTNRERSHMWWKS